MIAPTSASAIAWNDSEGRKISGVPSRQRPSRIARPMVASSFRHLPNTHQVMTRYDGWYANRPRGAALLGGAPAAHL